MGKKHKKDRSTPVGWEQPVWMCGDNLPRSLDSTAPYFQCVLRKGDTRTTTWIERKFAVEGKPIRVMRKGEWEGGWHVESVGNVAHQEDVLRMSTRHSGYRDWRTV